MHQYVLKVFIANLRNDRDLQETILILANQNSNILKRTMTCLQLLTYAYRVIKLGRHKIEFSEIMGFIL